MDDVIYPTHQCFDDAIDFILRRCVAKDALLDSLYLVHGVGTVVDGIADGCQYAHGWVEENGVCWDAGIFHGERTWYSRSRSDFYLVRGIIKSTRYTLLQAMHENRRTGNYGPWQTEYVKLCRMRVLRKHD